MTLKDSDVWLWVGLAITSYYAAMTVHTQLLCIRKASEINRQEKPPSILNQRTENDLKVETLGQLSQNANPDIRDASVRILREKLLQDGPAWQLMLDELGGHDAEPRAKALTCLRFVLPYCHHNQKADDLVHSTRTFNAIIDCLCAMLPEARQRYSESPDPEYRSQPERDAMWILQKMLPYHSAKARDAGIISRWLVRYPFSRPGTPSSSCMKKRFMSDIVDGVLAYEDEEFGCAMQSILTYAFKDPDLRDELRTYNMMYIDQYLFEVDDGTGYVPEEPGVVGVVNPETTPQDDQVQSPISSEVIVDLENVHRDVPGRRREESIEEQALRRRRRMAMVLGENGRPIQSEDIIQRDPMVLDEDVEEELEQLMEEVTEAEEADESGWRGFLGSVGRLMYNGMAPLSSQRNS